MTHVFRNKVAILQYCFSISASLLLLSVIKLLIWATPSYLTPCFHHILMMFGLLKLLWKPSTQAFQ